MGILLEFPPIPLTFLQGVGSECEEAGSPKPTDCSGIQCPVLWHQNVSYCWKARPSNRQRLGEKLSPFHPVHSCEISYTVWHSFQNMVIFMIKMLSRECWSVMQNQQWHPAWNSTYEHRINSCRWPGGAGVESIWESVLSFHLTWGSDFPGTAHVEKHLLNALDFPWKPT